MKKKIVVMMIAASLFMFLTSEKNASLTRKIIASTKVTDNYAQKSYFKKLSVRYYGTEKFWEELILVNNPTSYVSEENLIIPSYVAIKNYKLNQIVNLMEE